MTRIPALTLTRLHLDRLPGIGTSFSVPAEPGINLVVGPNEVGKSSLARSVFHLLWPQTKAATPFSVQGEFSDENGPLLARRDDNGPVTWTRDGQSHPAPEMPGAHVAPGYRLGLLDLNRRDGGDLDRQLAQEIRRQMAGGFDLAEVRDLFPDRNNRLNHHNREWNKARQELHQCQLQQKALVEQERGLVGLTSEQRRARLASQRAAQLLHAQEHHALTTRLGESEARLAELPANMAQVRAGDHDDLTNLQQRLAGKEQLITDLVDEISQRADQMAQLDFTGDLTKLAALVKHAESLATRVAESARNLAAATAAMDKARTELAPELLTADIPAGSSAAFERLAAVHRELAAQQVRAEHLDRLLDLEILRAATGDEPLTDDAAISESVVSDMLTGNALHPPGRGLLIGGLLGLVVAAGLLVISPQQPWAAALVLVVFGIGNLGQWFRRRSACQQACRQLEEQCRQTGHPLPAGWTPREALDDLLKRAQAAGECSGGHRAHDALRKELQRRQQAAQTDLDAAATRRRDLLRELGQDENLPDHGLLENLDRLARWRALASEHEAADGTHQYDQTTLATAIAETRNRLAAVDNVASPTDSGAEPETVPILQARLDNLQSRQTRLAGLQDTQSGAEKSLREAMRDLAADTTSREALLARLALSTAKTAAVLDELVLARVNALPVFENLTRDLVTTRRDRARLEDKLEAGDELPAAAEILALTDVERDKRLAEENRLAKGAEQLTAEIASITTQVDLARAGDEWEKLRAVEAERAADLVELLATQRAHALGRLLIDTVEKRHDDDTQPPLLTEMNRHLTIFTEGRYRLRVTNTGGDDQRFIALDNIGTPRELTELSDGTRAQLLLAARLAYLARSETELSLPLFLDEALTASDPVRFDAIAGAIGQLSADSDRQVFYLTSNPTDVAAWQRALAQRNLAPAHVIDLGTERGLGAAADATLDLPVLPVVPHPGDESAAEYGRQLNVPTLQPWDHENAVHVFHLWKDDLELVHRLLQGGTRTLGQWDQLGHRLVRAGIITAAESAKIQARGQLYGSFLDTWRVGRGRPLTRTTLVDSEALSDRFMPAAIDLLKATAGDGDAFMAGVEDGKIKRLNKNKKEALQDYLERQGHLDKREIWSPDNIVTHVLGTVAESLSAGVLTVDEVRRLVLDLHRLAQATNHHSDGSGPTD